MASYILTIDQGTTSSRALIVDRQLNVMGVGQKEFPQIFPQPGWVEHNPNDIWDTVRHSITEAVRKAGIDARDLAGIGITNQRETVVVWDKETDEPLYNAIVWQCRRTAPMCATLREKGYGELFSERTGLLLDPYFSGTKLAWLIQNVPGIKDRMMSDKVKAGTIDCFLVDRLSGGTSHVTDVSNAARTLLFNIHTLRWDEELLKLLGVPAAMLPHVAGNSEHYGRTHGLDFLPDGIPICGMAGDQQAALFGQACFEPGEAKCTFGTGAFLLMNTGTRAVPSRNRLLTTIAWKLGNETTYALEGSAFVAGAAVQWLRDGLGIIKTSAEVEELALSVPSSEGVVMVPAFAGLGAPHWNPDARAILTGLTRGTTRAHIARATLEAIALQNYEILQAMESDSGVKLNRLKVDGGASANNLMMQFQADILGCEIERPVVLETTAMGAAFLAGLSAGVWRDLDDVRQAWRSERRFAPTMDAATRDGYIQRYQAAVAKA